MMPKAARAEIRHLEQQHGARRSWIWASLGQAPLASSLKHLVALADCTERPLGGAEPSDIASSYAEWGWQTDAAALDALASVTDAADVKVIKGAVLALYQPWLEAASRVFQDSIANGKGIGAYHVEPLAALDAGACILFSDAMRFDVGKRLAYTLNKQGATCSVEPRLAALPTVTSTAKPAIAPVADMVVAGTGIGTKISVTGMQLTAEALRRLLVDSGYQVLRGEELGDPTGRGWTESSAIDKSGHQHGWRIAYQLEAELRALEQRIVALLEWGWQQVVVVTDHGWLLLPGGLPKAELSEHLTEVRKGRCARLKAGVSTNQQTVPWYWDPDVRIAVAPGIACYEAGKEYEHGGLSPQECVVPMLRVTRSKSTDASVSLSNITWKGMRCVARIAGDVAGLKLDIRSTANDAASSLAAPKAIAADGSGSVLVEDEDRAGEAALLVVIASDGTLRAQASTTIGG